MLRGSNELDNFYEEDSKQVYGSLAKILIIFAALCFFTSLVFSCGSRVARETVTFSSETVLNSSEGEGQTVGPIRVNSSNTVYEVSVSAKSLSSNSWASITGQVLDSQKQYLFAFGKELWRESGYSGGESWSESDTSFDMKVTIKKPGEYYLRFTSEAGRTNSYSSSAVSPPSALVIVSKKAGSSLPHMWAGILALVLAVVFNEIRSQTIGNLIQKAKEIDYDV